MLRALGRHFFGTVNERIVKSLRKYIAQINALEATYQAMTDSELQGQTGLFKARLAKGETLDDLLPEAFAVVREASVRVMGLRHFDVQLLGGVALHQGMIAEMRTGEGKTLVATLPTYLNALAGQGVHVITVNDYLASRDAEWMGKIYRFLGLTVGCIVHELNDDERREAYRADITYGTNNEFGFDYLRDNMKFSLDHMVQRPFFYAIVDEVDSILVDEARTPLIISGPTEDHSELYTRINTLIPKLDASDYEKDEKSRTVALTDQGVRHIEELLEKEGLMAEGGNLYDMENVGVLHHVNQALRAHKLFTRDVDYMVKDQKVMIIDEFTGRIMEGRRYSEGLHQALEAKEHVAIQNENQTLASITFQNYFRLYPKLAGMTGTAMTEATEFYDIYKLEVVEIPTNVAVQRIDEDDLIYRTAKEKYDAVLKVIEERHKEGQPILVGTISIEKSESISELLKQKNIPHQVLNARYHEQEAHIIAQAGRPGAVTIATNMAGRGTDIRLGGNEEMLIEDALANVTDPLEQERVVQKIKAQVEEDKKKVLAAGGLLVLASERHESRRIDNQLRGRSGRQGDPGHTKFFLSLEDDLMRIFGSERISGLLQRLGLQEGEAIFHPMVSRALAKAQQRVEARNYEIRKNLLKFDDVMNDQRKIVYEQRIVLMKAKDVSDTVAEMREQLNEQLVARYIPERAYRDEWDVEGLQKQVERIYGTALPIQEWADEEGMANEEILARIEQATKEMFEKKAARDPEAWRFAEKRTVLLMLDHLWKDHLLSLDHLRQGINLRAYGQKDPLNEYKREAFQAFSRVLTHLQEVVIEQLAHVEIVTYPNEEEITGPFQEMHESRANPLLVSEDVGSIPAMGLVSYSGLSEKEETESGVKKVGRNDPCPCQSGKKYKHCHGKLE